MISRAKRFENSLHLHSARTFQKQQIAAIKKLREELKAQPLQPKLAEQTIVQRAVDESKSPAQKAITDHSLAVGFSRGFEVSALIAVIALVVTLVMIRVTKEDLQGVTPPMMG